MMTGADFVHRVVAGVLRRDDTALLCHRVPAREWYPGLWDLPGGHVEAGETPVDALVRELDEEIGILATRVDPGALLRVDEEDLDLTVFLVAAWVGEPRIVDSAEHDELRWCSSADLRTLPIVDVRLVGLLTSLLAAL